MAKSNSSAVKDALTRLGIQRLVLSVHQASFPAGEKDLGVGTPYGERAEDFLRFIHRLGFTGVSLGPSGITSRMNASPYDGTLFSINPMFVPLSALGEGVLGQRLNQATLESVVEGASRARSRVSYVHAWDTARSLLLEIREKLRASSISSQDLDRELASLVGRRPTLKKEAGFEATAAVTKDDDWRSWPDSAPVNEVAADTFLLIQWWLGNLHTQLQRRARSIGLSLYADMQIGISHRDHYLHRGLFMENYRMGAPPSRTNPEGQAWDYPVLDPALTHSSEGRSCRFLQDRLDWALSRHSGLRIDHPHGWVCPWVYRAHGGDLLERIKSGARLFSSPNLPDHPELQRWSLVRPDQIDPSRPRFDDNWIAHLEEDQVRRFSVRVDLLMERAKAWRVAKEDLMIEVLSTCPRPLAAVLARHGLGRFRVTQKAEVEDPQDPYRSDTAREEDWVMVGNHDTAPLSNIVASWQGTEKRLQYANYLARRLTPSGKNHAKRSQQLAQDDISIKDAILADLFIGPAQKVLIFWADLFGESERFNRPGQIHQDNWSLRVPSDFENVHGERVKQGIAPHLGRALASALEARGLNRDPEGAALHRTLTHLEY